MRRSKKQTQILRLTTLETKICRWAPGYAEKRFAPNERQFLGALRVAPTGLKLSLGFNPGLRFACPSTPVTKTCHWGPRPWAILLLSLREAFPPFIVAVTRRASRIAQDGSGFYGGH